MCESCGLHGSGPSDLVASKIVAHTHEQLHHNGLTHSELIEAVPFEEAQQAHAGIKVAVVGKGGVGKSTLVALIARIAARLGADVLAIDADEQRNLATTLGIPLDIASHLPPITADKDYVEEKTGARPGEGGGAMLVLNPDVSDLVDRLGIYGPDEVRLLVMGGVSHAGGGCLCPETSLLAAAVSSMRLRKGELVIMDTHAGVEHFGRALARGFELAVVVVDSTFNSVQVGIESARLASELGIGSIHLVVNRLRQASDLSKVMDYVDGLGGFSFSSLHWLPYDEHVMVSEPSIEALLEGSLLANAVSELVDDLFLSSSVVSRSPETGIELSPTLSPETFPV